MRLYHFTSERHLAGIAAHGLTVGDVPTDIAKGKGRVGVWFTSSDEPFGHGLGGATQKERYRLAVDFRRDAPLLHKWTDWFPANITADTADALHRLAGGWETWFVYFGIVRPEAIVECFDGFTGQLSPNWRNRPPSDTDLPGVPAWRREAWQRAMLKRVAKAVKRQNG